MYPVLFRLGEFEITSFGVLVGIAALVGIWMFTRELERSGLDAKAADAAIAGVIGGLVGAKLLWTIEYFRRGADCRSALQPRRSELVRRADRRCRHRTVDAAPPAVALVPALAAAAPALAIGHAIGRLGCFMVGDDYGRPSDLPWAVAFPEGRPPTSVPVHPTQLYEAAALVVIAWLLVRWRRIASPITRLRPISRPRWCDALRDRVHPRQPAHRRSLHIGAIDFDVLDRRRRDPPAPAWNYNRAEQVTMVRIRPSAASLAAVLLVTHMGVTDAAQSRIASAKTLRCSFPRHAVGTWGKDGAPEATVLSTPLVLRFDSIDPDSGTAQLRAERWAQR